MPDTHRRPRAVRSAAGEVVEVQGGGHIVRATGRKDRHSKVCTAKGLRDRRVRLSAHTAIQFYDVQDRLGLDRPSKAVDWLIKNAKPSIDQLAQLPPWRPPPPSPPPAGAQKRHLSNDADDYSASPYGYCAGGSSSLLPPSLVTDQIADTIKSFFPMPAAASASSGYASGVGLLPHAAGGSGRHAEDLRLSLQSFQDPIFNHQQSRAGPMAFQDPIFNLAEPAGGDAAGPGGRYLFGLSSQLVQNQFFTQWGTLQSSHPPSIRAMENPNALSGHQTHLTSFRRSSTPPAPAYRSAASEIGGVGFSGYHFPARIQGGEEHDGPPPSAPRH